MTRVSESSSRPLASWTCSLPASPAAVRSDSRCITAMLCSPYWRASFQLSRSQRAMARCRSTTQASSSTTIRRTPSLRAQEPCSQAAVQAIRIGRASSLTSRRLNTTSRPDRSSPAEVGPSNMPRRSPAPMRRSDRASWRPSSASRTVEVRSSWAVASDGSNSRLTTCGMVGWARRAAASTTASWWARSRQASSSGRRLRPSMTPEMERSRASWASPPIIGSSGLSRSVPPLAKRIGSTPHICASRSYSPFGSIDDAVPEDRRVEQPAVPLGQPEHLAERGEPRPVEAAGGAVPAVAELEAVAGPEQVGDLAEAGRVGAAVGAAGGGLQLRAERRGDRLDAEAEQQVLELPDHPLGGERQLDAATADGPVAHPEDGKEPGELLGGQPIDRVRDG